MYVPCVFFFCDAFVLFGLCGTLSSLLGPPHPWNDCQAVR